MLKRCLSRKLSILTAILLTTGLASTAQLNPPIGQSPWKWVNPAPIGFSVLDLSFADNNVGLAVGVWGGIARTTDAGTTWQSVPLKFINNTNTLSIASFNGVQMVNSTIAYAVGSSGLMIKSTDGGINWTTLNTPLTPLGRNINTLYFVNKDTGYIGGQSITTGNTTSIDDAPKVYVTRNGGASWDALVTPFVPQSNAPTLNWNNQKEISRIHFANDSVGYVSGSGGSNFTAGQSSLLWKIKNNVITDYSLHRTKFGLTTGTHQPSVQTFKGLVAVNDTLVLMSSLNNNVVVRVKTGVNDSTASALPASYGNYVKGVYEVVIWLNSTATPYPANLVGQVAGQMQQLKKMSGGRLALASGNTLVFTSDNGTTWTYTRPTPPMASIAHWGYTALDITPNGRIVAGNFNGLINDSLPGSPWKTGYKNLRPLFYSYSSVDWADCNNGIAVGANGTISKTTNAGVTWTDVSNTVFDAGFISLGNVFYQSTTKMFFTGGNTIYKSADQGTTNDAIFTEPVANASILGFEMVGLNKAFAVGYRSNPAVQRTMIFRSLNPDAASPVWDTVKTFPVGNLAPQLRNIKFANADTGYVVGNRSKIYRTTDGGATWKDISYDTLANATINYTGLAVVNGKTLFVGGSSRRVLKSTDAGETWTDLSLNIATNPIVVTSFTSVSNIVMNDASNGYIQAGGILLRTTDGWTSWTADLAPTGMNSIHLYPKVPGPLSGKKLYITTVVAGFPGPISTQSAALLEYGVDATYTLRATEVVTNATCATTQGATITVNATGGIAPLTYSLNGGAFQTSNVFTGQTSGTKTIIIKDAGCQTVTRNVTLNIPASPAVSAGADKSITEGESVLLDGSSNSQVSTISWTPANTLTSATSFNPTAKPLVTTTYTLTVTNSNNCVSTDNVTVTVLPFCLKTMEAFTPNGDGINDKWLVTQGSNCTSQIEVKVYNRYGSMVYSNLNYSNDWNGTYEGKPVADGTYYYRITFRLLGGGVRTTKGNVTIIR